MPITAMAACMILLSASAPVCMDAHKHIYLCIDGKCRTPRQVQRDWAKSPKKKLADYMKLYGYK